MPLEPGSIFAGKYRIESTLGVGGMGRVLAAVHVGLDQQVALKVLQPELARDEALVQRFVREAKAVAKISGDHVVKVFDVGTSDGVPFIVLELLHGLDLAELVETRGPMAVCDAVDSVIEACHAIAQAHAAGVVHRDLKPSNLFLSTAGDGATTIKVLDFGISKLMEPGDDDVQVTRTREVFGSPVYMSPEQLRASRNVDARSDVWSLGVVLFELMTGSAPFEGESAMAVGGAILHGEPASLRGRRTDVPEALERVIATCLRKNANERYESVADLVNALAPFASSRGQALVPKIARISVRSFGPAWTDSSVPHSSDPSSHRSIPAPLESATTMLIASPHATNGNWATGAPRSGGRPWLAVVASGLVFAAVAGVALIFLALREPHVVPAAPLASEPPASASGPLPSTSAGATTSSLDTDAVPSAAVSVAPSPPSSAAKVLRSRRPATTASVAAPRTGPAAAAPVSTATPAVPDRVRDRHGMDE